MVDLRADTASSSDKTEFTETEDQSRTHQLSTAHTAQPQPDLVILVFTDQNAYS